MNIPKAIKLCTTCGGIKDHGHVWRAGENVGRTQTRRNQRKVYFYENTKS